jgi:RNA polymerase sigma factor (sigma-70 family)
MRGLAITAYTVLPPPLLIRNVMTPRSTIYVVDDDDAVRDSLAFLLEAANLPVETFADAEAFLAAIRPEDPGCLILDVSMPGMDGPTLQAALTRQGVNLPIIFLTAHGTIPMTVKAIQAGAMDFLTKPVEAQHLLERVQSALRLSIDQWNQESAHSALRKRFSSLSERERQVLELVLVGQTNKEIAKQIGISFRTVEHHRSRILLKTGVDNLVQLARLADACR